MDDVIQWCVPFRAYIFRLACSCIFFSLFLFLTLWWSICLWSIYHWFFFVSFLIYSHCWEYFHQSFCFRHFLQNKKTRKVSYRIINLCLLFFFCLFFCLFVHHHHHHQESISNLILKYNEYGFLDQLHRKWYGRVHCLESTSLSKPEPLTVRGVAGVFLMLTIGILVGIIILLAEHFTFKYLLPGLRKKPKDCFWKSPNLMFFSQVFVVFSSNFIVYSDYIIIIDEYFFLFFFAYGLYYI